MELNPKPGFKTLTTVLLFQLWLIQEVFRQTLQGTRLGLCTDRNAFYTLFAYPQALGLLSNARLFIPPFF